MAIDFIHELNDEQYRVVTEGDGPCLVLAGAGSGKTRTLVYRVAYLLEQGIDPSNILLVTFTNKAAKEMTGRVERLIGFRPEGLNSGTFHHVGNLTLRHYADRLGYKRNFTILDSDDSADMVKSVMASLGYNTKGQNFPKASVVYNVLSFAHNSHSDVRTMASEVYDYPDFIAAGLERIDRDYTDKKRVSNAMDFDDLLVNWLNLLQNEPEVRDRLSRQYKYILVDEYQDTNYLQAAVINELSRVNNNVLVVGDDAQSIYSFRAADVNNILNFPKDYPQAKTFYITKNYRSTPEILALANNSISHNRDKFEKTLFAVRANGFLPSVTPTRDVYQQATLIANRIIELHERGVDYDLIAVLFRSVYHTPELQLELARRNVPFVVRGGIRYFEQAHIKDVVSYLKILANFKDELAWKRILRQHDGIGETSAEKIWQQINQFTSLAEFLHHHIDLRSSRAIQSWDKIIGLFRYLHDLDYARKGNIADAVLFIVEHGYKDYLKNTFENYKDRLDDLHEFVNFVMTYENLDQLLADVMLSESFAKGEETRDHSVVLTTIHQAKGLEWPYVIILGLRDGDFPHYKSIENTKELEEERRLFYVATTRAKDELYMYYPLRKNTFQYGEMYGGPSTFLRELDDSRYTTTKRFESYHEKEDHDDDYGEKVIYYD